jgi:hypothetical protein
VRQGWRIAPPKTIGITAAVVVTVVVTGAILEKARGSKDAAGVQRLAREAEEDHWRRMEARRRRRRDEEAHRSGTGSRDSRFGRSSKGSGDGGFDDSYRGSMGSGLFDDKDG